MSTRQKTANCCMLYKQIEKNLPLPFNYAKAYKSQENGQN